MSIFPFRADHGDDGLFRTRLAGRHARTTEAFHCLRATAEHAAAPHAKGPALYGQRVAVSDDPAEGYWEMISLRDEIFLVITSCHYAKERTESVLPEGFVEFHFILKGPARVEFSESGQVQIGSPNLTVVQQGDDMLYQVHCGPGPWRSVSLYVTQEYFDAFAKASLGADNSFQKKLNAVGNEQVSCHQMPVGVEVIHAIEKLLANPYQGYRRLLFAEAKACEILCASLDLWQHHIENENAPGVFSTRDLRLIEKARDIMLSDMTRVPTIPELARAVGTNTSKLKRGFKFLYGMTVFEFGHSHRMNRALNLLIQDRLSVNEVACAVGYQHQTSFTASFREHFGFAPKDARRMSNPEEILARHADPLNPPGTP